MGFEECILNKGVRLCVGISKQTFYIFNWIQIIKYITNENDFLCISFVCYLF